MMTSATLSLPKQTETPADTQGLPISTAEAAVFEKIFQAADVDGRGSIPVQNAVSFLLKSKLPQQVLSEIWQIVAPEGDGLDRKSFFRIVKFIALIQYQKPAGVEYLNIETPPPYFEGVQIPGLTNLPPLLAASQPPPPPSSAIAPPASPAPLAPLSIQNTGTQSIASISTQNTGSSGPIGTFALTQAEIDRFSAAFAACNPVGGHVSGDAAKPLFLKSDLPAETLGRIWVLVDTNGALKLNMNQFFCAMYLIFKLKSGALPTVPNYIPNGLWTAITAATGTIGGGAISNVSSPVSAKAPPSLLGDLATPSPPSMKVTSSEGSSSGIFSSNQSQLLSGASLLPPPPGSGSPPSIDRRRTMMGRVGSSGPGIVTPTPPAPKPAVQPPSMAAVTSGQEWGVKEEDRTLAFQFFEQLDVAKRGYLTGEDSYDFFLKSNLDNAILAKIWDLSHISKNGKLSKEEFAVAYHLIKQVLSGTPLPDTLPPSLVPPKLRPTTQPSPTAMPPLPDLSSRATVMGAPTQRSAPPPPSMAPTISFDASDNLSVPLPQPAQAPKVQAAPDPFGLSDAFGGPDKTIPSLVPPLTALSPAKKIPPPIPETRPALGDISRRHTTMGSAGSLLTDDRAADLERAKAQLSALEKEFNALTPLQESLKTRRLAHETEASALAQKKQELNARFARIKAEYDEEVRIMKETEEALKIEQVQIQSVKAQLAETRRLLGEKQARKQQLMEAIQSCKEMVDGSQAETQQLTAALAHYRAELDRMGPELRNVQSELKRQTNVLNVNRQVLATAEIEYQRVKQEQAEVLENERKRIAMGATLPPKSPSTSGLPTMDKKKSASAHSLRSDSGSGKRPPAPPPPASRSVANALSPTSQNLPLPPSIASSPSRDPRSIPTSPASDPFGSRPGEQDPFAVPTSSVTSPEAKAFTTNFADAFGDVDFGAPAPAAATSAKTETLSTIAAATPADLGDDVFGASPFGEPEVKTAAPAPAPVPQTPIAAAPVEGAAPPPMPPLSTKPSRSNPGLSGLSTPSLSIPDEPPELPPLSTKPRRSNVALNAVAAAEEKKEDEVKVDVEQVEAAPAKSEETAPTADAVAPAPAPEEEIDFSKGFSEDAVASPPAATANTDPAFDFSAAFETAPASVPATSPSAAPTFDPFSADFAANFSTTSPGAGAPVKEFDFDEAFGGGVKEGDGGSAAKVAGFSFEDAFGGDPFGSVAAKGIEGGLDVFGKEEMPKEAPTSVEGEAVNVEDVKVEEIKAEEVKADEVKVEEVKVEGVKVEEVKDQVDVVEVVEEKVLGTETVVETTQRLTETFVAAEAEAPIAEPPAAEEERATSPEVFVDAKEETAQQTTSKADAVEEGKLEETKAEGPAIDGTVEES
ncbi:hypothetical protein HDU97_004377 [Phlyctochytrium planicorne]|nr:hypothetical protein HDU97_004377 [Phlyctochytrium planicorne]